MNYTVMMPAAGSGQRMGAGYNKLFLKLVKNRFLSIRLMCLKGIQRVTGIILAVKPEERDEIQSMLDQFGITKVKAMVDGGGGAAI